MERLKCDPLEALLRIVKNRRLSIALRMDAAKAAAPYCYPRLSTVFMAGKVDSDVNITGFLAAAQHDPELSAAMEKLSLAMCADERERKADDVIDAEFTSLALPAPEQTAPEPARDNHDA